MGLLSHMKWKTTTVLDLVEDAESTDAEVLDVVHLELYSGKDFVVAVVTGERAAKAAELLERLRLGEEL